MTKLSFKKLVVFAPFADPVNRKEAENQLKAKIVRAEVIPSYTILPDRKDSFGDPWPKSGPRFMPPEPTESC